MGCIMTLFSMKLFNLNLFNVLFNLTIAMKDNGYFYAGQIMAMSIAHGGQSPCFLSELLYECLQKGPDNVKVKTEQIADEETKSLVESVSIFSCSY